MLATEISAIPVDRFRQMIPARFLNLRLVVLLLANIGEPAILPSTYSWVAGSVGAPLLYMLAGYQALKGAVEASAPEAKVKWAEVVLLLVEYTPTFGVAAASTMVISSPLRQATL
jgi:hypothetical protein